MKILKNNKKMGHWINETDNLFLIKDKITGVILPKNSKELKVYYGFKGKYNSYTGVSYNTLRKFKNYIIKSLKLNNAKYI